MSHEKKSVAEQHDIPIGGYLLAAGVIVFNENKQETKIRVRNTGDRPIQIGSHYHFFEVNPALEFNRSIAFGKRLNIASTTAIRFESGDEIEVSLIPFGGKRTLYGFNNLVDGWTASGDRKGAERPAKSAAIRRAKKFGFKCFK
ncbi:urease subunit beta (plasmid) [Hafnia alvei]|uniref:urease subunit beta n=1 Tax=Hafnia alvei TaxID=569 RepID=UPI000C9FAEAC|nr:urease subunit beta [Hafnia alvei]MBI0278620.1 urease subunit beta [Hafnia alvei]PNL03914.1 urease subunit beta [Hafnia alvei]